MQIRSFILGALAVLTAGTAEAQQRRITGRVTNEGKDPLAAASVTIVGTLVGAYTNEAGRFTLTAPSGGSVVLRVRRIGYQQKNVPVPAGQSDIEIPLTRDVLQLEAQVVTGTATTVSNANAANAVSVVSAEQLTRVSAPTIDNALQGKVAGAIITSNSGAPGGGTQVQLRGVSTILGNFTPLYVVDGVIVNNSTIPSGLNVVSGSARGNFSSSQDQSVNRVADLNPNDIESVQILKGPSASSIYGSKGTNGVIIITTKQGRAGRTNIDFTQRVGRSTLANKLGERCFTSAAEYGDWALINLGQKKTEAAAEYTAATNKCHDFEEEYYNNSGVAYETIASLRGGSQSGGTYFVSGLAKHDNGLAQNDFYNKQSMRANVGQTIGSRLTLNANTEILHTLTQRGISGNDNYGVSPIGVFAFTPSIYDLTRQADGTFPQNPSQINGPSNPFQNADQIKTPNNTYRFIGSVTSNLSLISSEKQTLDANVTGGVDTYKSNDRVVSPATNYADAATNGALAGTLFNSDGNFTNANLNGSLVHRLILPILTAQTSAGFGQQRREQLLTQLTGRGVIFPSVTNVSTAAQTFPNQTIFTNKDFGYFAQEELFALSERLLLTAGINAERSSGNGDQQKFYTYPKFSASYRLTTLPSMINDLKLRAAYGKAGNLPSAGRETFLTTLLYEGTTGTRASTIKGAADIHPELATETEGGFDLTMFSSRLRLSATSYKKKITDLLLTAPIVSSTGFTTQYLNGGQITNHGQELELDVTAYQRGTTSWISTNTFSRQRGFVDALPAGILPFIPASGSFSSRYGNAWIQPGQSTTIVQATVGCKVAVAPGGNCSSANRIIGFPADANPDFTAGFNNQVNIGALRLSGLLEWRKGGAAVNLTNNYCDAYNLCADTLVSQQRIATFNAGGTAYVENAGFVKLREVTVGFELPTTLTNNLFGGRAQSVRLELSGRNLKTWTKYTGLDPEVSNFGNQALGRFQDVTPYPPSRTFLFSLATSF